MFSMHRKWLRKTPGNDDRNKDYEVWSILWEVKDTSWLELKNKEVMITVFKHLYGNSPKGERDDWGWKWHVKEQLTWKGIEIYKL